MLSKSYTEQQCMTFYYNMYGDTMGELNVQVNGNTVFSKSNDQGNQWREAKATIWNNGSPYQVMIPYIK